MMNGLAPDEPAGVKKARTLLDGVVFRSITVWTSVCGRRNAAGCRDPGYQVRAIRQAVGSGPCLSVRLLDPRVAVRPRPPVEHLRALVSARKADASVENLDLREGCRQWKRGSGRVRLRGGIQVAPIRAAELREGSAPVAGDLGRPSALATFGSIAFLRSAAAFFFVIACAKSVPASS